MRNILYRFWKFICCWWMDPFGKKELVERHTKIIEEMVETRKMTRRVTVNPPFPLADLAGNPRIRRGNHNANAHSLNS